MEFFFFFLTSIMTSNKLINLFSFRHLFVGVAIKCSLNTGGMLEGINGTS